MHIAKMYGYPPPPTPSPPQNTQLYPCSNSLNVFLRLFSYVDSSFSLIFYSLLVAILKEANDIDKMLIDLHSKFPCIFSLPMDSLIENALVLFFSAIVIIFMPTRPHIIKWGFKWSDFLHVQHVSAPWGFKKWNFQITENSHLKKKITGIRYSAVYQSLGQRSF